MPPLAPGFWIATSLFGTFLFLLGVTQVAYSRRRGADPARRNHRIRVDDRPEDTPDLVARPPDAAELRRDRPRNGRWFQVLLAENDRPDRCFTGWAADVSPEGLGVVLFRNMDVGSVWKVRPTSAPESAPWARVEVRYCLPRAQDTWNIGCRFLDEARHNALKA